MTMALSLPDLPLFNMGDKQDRGIKTGLIAQTTTTGHPQIIMARTTMCSRTMASLAKMEGYSAHLARGATLGKGKGEVRCLIIRGLLTKELKITFLPKNRETSRKVREEILDQVDLTVREIIGKARPMATMLIIDKVRPPDLISITKGEA